MRSEPDDNTVTKLLISAGPIDRARPITTLDSIEEHVQLNWKPRSNAHSAKDTLTIVRQFQPQSRSDNTM